MCCYCRAELVLQVTCSTRHVAPDSEAFGVSLEVRVSKSRANGPPSRLLLLPADQAIVVVVKDEGRKSDSQPLGGLEFLAVHQESAIAHRGYYLPARVDEFCRDRPRQRDAHAGQAIRHDAAVRAIGGGVGRDPEL